jgi:hypothetical protein
MDIEDQEAKEIEAQILEGDRSNLPGAVRASFGMYNTEEEIDRFIDVLKSIVNKSYHGEYILDKKRGEYHPKDYVTVFEQYFRL